MYMSTDSKTRMCMRERGEGRRERGEREGGRERKRVRILINFLADEISKLRVQCEEWRTTLDTVQEARAQDRMHTQQLLATKVHIFEHVDVQSLHFLWQFDGRNWRKHLSKACDTDS